MLSKKELVRKGIGIAAAALLLGAQSSYADVIAVAIDSVTNYSFSTPAGGLSVTESPGQTTFPRQCNLQCGDIKQYGAMSGAGPSRTTHGPFARWR